MSLTTDPNDPDLKRGADKPGESGMNKKYLVMSEEERSKGFIRPVRRSYIHKVCGSLTTMGVALAETYARQPSFYGYTFCVSCNHHYPVSEFVWDGSDEAVGS